MFKSHYQLKYIQNILFSVNYLPYGNELALNTLKSNCETYSCAGLLVYIPSSDFWRPDSRQIKHVSLLKEFVDNINNIEFLDLTKDFKGLDIDGFSPKGPHLSILGNKIVYDKLSDWFK